MKRRDFLKTAGVLAAGTAVAPSLFASGSSSESEATDIFNPVSDKPGELNAMTLSKRGLEPEIGSKVLTVAIVGAGDRGRTYNKYCRMFPDKVKVVAVSDIIPERKDFIGDQWNIPAERRFGDFHEILAAGKVADAMFICTPDALHYEPCMKALAQGYHVLLEKPAAQTEKQVRDILAQSKKYNRVVALCHVLRYAPIFVALREVVKSGAIGDVVSIQHMEPVQYAHMAHSYVRGKWRDSKETTPIILAKSCHDLDIIRWLVDKPCKSIVADGSLYFFKKENAPAGAPERCTDGCPHASTCPYNAIDIYVKQKKHLGVFDLKDKKDEAEILAKLTPSQWSRCVFKCDNDQPDHYVANMVFEDGVTSSFTMDAFAPHGGRRTRIMGTMGFIDSDGKQFTVTDFLTRSRKTWNVKIKEVAAYKGAGHGGGDFPIVRDFVEAAAAGDPSRLTSSIDVSIESHVMGFAAERSRKSGKKEAVKM